MEAWYYPMLCWQVTPDHVCGHLLGLGWELAAGSAEKIRAAFGRRLQRDTDEEGRPLRPPISEAQLRIRGVETRPAYRDREGTYPLPSPVTVPVAAVCGPNTFGAYTCYLPLLKTEFFYYRPSQIDSLIEHFARDRFREMSPEEIHRLLMIGEPWLDRATVKVKGAKEAPKRRSAEVEAGPLLEAVAERHPWTKGVRSRVSAVPTGAWERGPLVKAVHEKIVREGANLILVGDLGVGRSAILHEVVRRIHVGGGAGEKRGEEDSLEGGGKPPFFWKTTARRLISGAKYFGDWQEICETLVAALRVTGGILWVEDLLELFRVGGRGPEDSLASFLVPFLDGGDLRIVGEMTPRELEAARGLLPGFVDRFRLVRVDELDRASMMKVLDEYAAHARKTLGVDIGRRALETAYRLLHRHVRYERFPGKAVRLLGECLNEAWLARRKSVGEGDVLGAFTELSGLPEIFLRDELPLEAEALLGFFRKRIIGQDDAVERVARVVRLFKAGLNDPAKPVATMLFAGPTGVGKTATARALAAFCFGAGQKLDPLLRLDMSEYQVPWQIERLIGSPDGEPGRLVQHLRERPFSVVLLDEIEKAHPVFFDALLAVLDEGLLADAYGRVTDFRNAIIVMTTNLGTRREGSLGFRPGAADRYEAEIREFFRPEFCNRIDQVVLFRPLGPEVILEIARKELGEMAAREGFRRRGLTVEFDESLVRRVAEVGFDPVYGARPLQRAIERHVVGPLSRRLLRDSPEGGTFRLSWSEGGLKVEAVRGSGA